MNLDNRTLETWLEKPPEDSFPLGKIIDYSTHYEKLKSYLATNVHKEVTTGANLETQDELLNDHGLDHIEKVIEKWRTPILCTTFN